MRAIVAVEDQLGNVRQALEEEGYQVVSVKEGMAQAAAIVVSGMDDQFMGRQDIHTKAPIIDASGLNANEVVSEVARAIEDQAR